MVRILMSSIPVPGQVAQALPVARILVERGHEVWWYTGAAFQELVEASGARYIPMQAAPDLSQPAIAAAISARKHRSALAKLFFPLTFLFAEFSLGQFTDHQRLLSAIQPDILLGDFGSLGTRFTAEKYGLLWAMLGITALPMTSRDTAPFGPGIPPDNTPLGRLRNQLMNWSTALVFNGVTREIDRARKQAGLPPGHQGYNDALLSPYLYLQGTVPAFEYPRSDLPPQVHFVGPFLPPLPTDFTPPHWWDDLQTDQPVIYVTQGTAATDPSDLIIPTLKALADEPMLVVATPWKSSSASLKLSPLPSNARIEPFIPLSALLPSVTIMITNGGYGGVHLALAHGVPLLAAGTTEEKLEVNAHIAWSGVGINLKTKTPTPAQIRAAVKKILIDPRYRQKARQIQADIARHNGPLEAAFLLEQLAETRRPIYRKDAVLPADNFYRYQQEQLSILQNWGGGSLLVGLLLLVQRRPFWRQLGGQAVGWGAINLALARSGRRSASKKEARLGQGELDAAHARRDARRLYWILVGNAALDIGYILGGAWLLRRAGRQEGRRGLGVGIILQGLWLLRFDSRLAREIRRRWIG